MPNNEHSREPHHVRRQYNEMCRNCYGTGKRDGGHCLICEGHGIVKITKEILIYVEPINLKP